MRFGLVPVSDRGEIILQGQITAFALPAQRLDGYFQVFFKANGIGNMPAVLAEAVLVFDTIKTGVRGTEIGVNIFALRAWSLLVAIRAAEIIFLAGAADSREFIGAVTAGNIMAGAIIPSFLPQE